MKLKYKHPKLYMMNIDDLFSCACMIGDSANFGVSCKAGADAGTDCRSGMSAANQCVAGAVAGTKCDNGVCFE